MRPEDGATCRGVWLQGVAATLDQLPIRRTEFGTELSTLLPPAAGSFPGNSRLKLVFLLDTPAGRAPLLGPVKDELNRVLAGRIRLYGMKRVTLVDFDRAQAMGLPVTRT